MLQENTALLPLPAEAEAANSLLQSAELEFQASLQLLADRACWISASAGAAIAIEENGLLVYCVVAGMSDRETGTTIDRDSEPYRECLSSKRTVHMASSGESQTIRTFIPIVREERATGLLELNSSDSLSVVTEESLSRIAGLITVTLEHRDAAERAGRFSFMDEELSPPLPDLWHAPEPVTKSEAPAPAYAAAAELKKSKTSVVAPEVRACAACGFPVSPGRALCVECEQNPESVPAAPSLFSTEAEESWLSAHGYTIASVLVTVLTVAIILWLRR
jgi:hypothetical protein